MCNYLPGGKTAGQISLQATFEHNAKMSVLHGDNELESDYLGQSGANDPNGNNKEKKIPPRESQYSQSHSVDFEYVGSPMVNRMSSGRSSFYVGEDIGI